MSKITIPPKEPLRKWWELKQAGDAIPIKHRSDMYRAIEWWERPENGGRTIAVRTTTLDGVLYVVRDSD